MLKEIKSDSSPNTTQQKFAEEIGSNEIILEQSQIDAVKNISIPILLIHGDKDSQISVKNAYEIKKNNENIEKR